MIRPHFVYFRYVHIKSREQFLILSMVFVHLSERCSCGDLEAC